MNPKRLNPLKRINPLSVVVPAGLDQTIIGCGLSEIETHSSVHLPDVEVGVFEY